MDFKCQQVGNMRKFDFIVHSQGINNVVFILNPLSYKEMLGIAIGANLKFISYLVMVKLPVVRM